MALSADIRIRVVSLAGTTTLNAISKPKVGDRTEHMRATQGQSITGKALPLGVRTAASDSRSAS